jgi:proline-specific peptidase
MSSFQSPKFTEGKIDFTHQGETYQTYYKLFGDLENRTRNPLVVLHGGPGLCHNYLFPFSQLTEKYGVPVILYDQLGNAKSTHLKEKPLTFWTIDLFIDELVNLLNHFNIQDGFDLVGHSWGGILASEFEVRRQPAGLKHLIIASSLAAYSLWNQSNGQLMQAFSDEVKQGLMGGMKEPEKFFDALKELHAVHGCVTRPVPPEYWYTLDQVFGPDGDPTVASAP